MQFSLQYLLIHSSQFLRSPYLLTAYHDSFRQTNYVITQIVITYYICLNDKYKTYTYFYQFLLSSKYTNKYLFVHYTVSTWTIVNIYVLYICDILNSSAISFIKSINKCKKAKIDMEKNYKFSTVCMQCFCFFFFFDYFDLKCQNIFLCLVIFTTYRKINTISDQ